MKNRVMTLGEISVFIRNGVTIKQNNQEKSGYPITRIETISDGTIDQNRMGYAGIFEKEKYQNWFLENEDILISHINSEKHLGKSAIYFGDKEKIIHGMNLLCFRTKKEIVISSYLYFYFKSLKYKKNIGKIAKKSVNQASFSIKDFRDIEINLPDIENQKKIVEKLKTIYEILKLKEEQVKKLSELSKCLFCSMFKKTNDAFNWKESTIGETCKLKSGTTLNAKIENEGGNIPYIKVADMNCISNEKYIKTSTHFVTENTAGKGIFDIGTTIFPKRGGAIGTNKKRLTIKPICADLNVMGVTPKELLHPEYIYMYFQMLDMNLLNNGSSVPQINNKDIEPLIIKIPPIELQNKFAERIKLIEKSKFEIQQSIDETQKLFDSLMEKYFG